MLKKLLIPIAAMALLGACDFGPAPATPAPPVAPSPTVSYMLFFDWDSAKLTDKAMATVNEAAGIYKERGATRVAVTGYTDTTGSADYNTQLSLRRGNAVKDALMKGGVPATAITVTSSGEMGLLVPTAQDVRDERNRRVQIVITK